MPRQDEIRDRTDREDRELVRRALQGKPEAFGEIVRRYQGPIFNLAVRVVRDRDEAQDVAQEAFVKAYAALGRYDPTYPLRVWLFRIAHNAAIDHVRRRRSGMLSLDAPRRLGDDEVGWEIEDEESPGPSEQVEAGERRDALNRALGKLAPALRSAIVLRHVEDLSYEEIAATLGIPLGTVKIRIHRGREALAKILRRELGRDGEL